MQRVACTENTALATSCAMGVGRRVAPLRYAAQKGRPVLVKREEDKNGDGKIDVTSVYENGKLVRREITDANMTPL